MNDAQIAAVSREISDAALGRRLGRIFPLARTRLAIDLRIPSSQYLFISIEPAAPRAYLVERRLRDLERAATPPGQFHLAIKKLLAGGALRSVAKVESERVLVLEFDTTDDFGSRSLKKLVVQLTGRSSNLFVLDEAGHILASMRETRGDGQQVGQRYSPPERPANGGERREGGVPVTPDVAGSISKVLDEYFLRREAEQAARSRIDAARSRLRAEVARRRKLIGRLESDLAAHGDAGRWKKFGDLILAHLADARVENGRISVTDLFDPQLPRIEIEVDENRPLTESAESYFKRYTRARNAAVEIAARLETVRAEIDDLERRLRELDSSTADAELPDTSQAAGKTAETAPRQKEKTRAKAQFRGARRFRSSDGYDILVGKKAADNDHLTFRVAGPNDLWLHAADYPGSHVVVRNPNRTEVPQKTLFEAAQLAAFYSSGRKQTKAAVNYTQKKFVNKPKGSALGLVRLASFKTVLVEPRVPPIERAED
ncbi:MAG: NFACT family protein [Pyrinomonadaceae bacterium]